MYKNTTLISNLCWFRSGPKKFPQNKFWICRRLIKEYDKLLLLFLRDCRQIVKEMSQFVLLWKLKITKKIPPEPIKAKFKFVEKFVEDSNIIDNHDKIVTFLFSYLQVINNKIISHFIVIVEIKTKCVYLASIFSYLMFAKFLLTTDEEEEIVMP